MVHPTAQTTAGARDPFKGDQVYTALRQRIMAMALEPGAPLRKEEIAAEFNVSRAPVSDAIARLAEDGLVDVYPQYGSFVAQLRSRDVREGLFIRIALEVEVVRQATALDDAALVTVLTDNIAAQEAALAAGDLDTLYALDEAMHEALFAAIDRPRAGKILEAARAPLDRMRQIVLPLADRPQATVREHRWIVEAVQSGDPEFAAAAMRAHLHALSASMESQLSALDAQGER